MLRERLAGATDRARGLVNRQRLAGLAGNGRIRYAALGVLAIAVAAGALLGVNHNPGTPDTAGVADSRSAEDQAARGDERPSPEPSSSSPSPSETREPKKAEEEPKKTEEPEEDELEVPASCDEESGNRRIGCTMMIDYGFGAGNWSCLETLWDHESGWNHHAENPSSGAYGIPQALPGSKMGSAGDDWADNPATQIEWGLDYIAGRYDTPCGAWGFWQSNNWY